MSALLRYVPSAAAVFLVLIFMVYGLLRPSLTAAVQPGVTVREMVQHFLSAVGWVALLLIAVLVVRLIIGPPGEN
jgi:hypothetical protein